MSNEDVERVLAGRICIDMTRILVEYQLKVTFLRRILNSPFSVAVEKQRQPHTDMYQNCWQAEDFTEYFG